MAMLLCQVLKLVVTDLEKVLKKLPTAETGLLALWPIISVMVTPVLAVLADIQVVLAASPIKVVKPSDTSLYVLALFLHRTMSAFVPTGLTPVYAIVVFLRLVKRT